MSCSIPPHHDRELEMLRAETKPLAHLWPQDDVGDLEVTPHRRNGSECWLIHKSSNAWRARAFIHTYDMRVSGSISNRMAHVRCGVLLGYDKEAILHFVDKYPGTPLLLGVDYYGPWSGL